ncbi:hypothetical protein LJC34_06205 [Oscillospiraceae bacterium OttesenSCG-928-G22]|nr:hypothetical protein [Oscillospiraceae bacterium OttesenSCG-928-G22]
MLDHKHLNALREIDITTIDPATLVDINQIHIDQDSPIEIRMEKLINQIGNPYCFRCGDVPVQIRFVSDEKNLPQSLENYFCRLK